MKETRKVQLLQTKAGYELQAIKTPRNMPCPCGSGKKAKHCHGAETIYRGIKRNTNH